MDIHFSGRHVEVTEAVRQFAEGRFGKLERFFDRIGVVRVTFAGESSPRSVSVRLALVRGKAIAAEGKGKDFLAAIDQAAERVERQLERYKSKLRGR